MPGHVKLGGSKEPDPDPSQYLYISFEMKKEDSLKPYDPKKSVWVPDEDEGYKEGLITETVGDKINVKVGWEIKTFKAEDPSVGQVNPPKMEKIEDMSSMTYLNDASVLWNLKNRYQAKLIYTYSGLFCVVVNPYRRYPIYTNRVVNLYIGKRRAEVPPHLFAISEGAYQGMMSNGKDQSMLITGESGAGKTENTKKVISYFANVGSTGKKKAGQEKKANLEDQIVQTNPLLESYGNAKTVRNDNSSRFGKFIKIYFNSLGKLAGCDIETYILEKSRVTYQQTEERGYHIFYQLVCAGVVEGLQEKCLLSDDIFDYFFVSQGKVKVDSIDDYEELEFTDQSFEILLFSEEEKWGCYKATATLMHLGEITFKQKGREEQAEVDDPDPPMKVSELMGVPCEELMKGFLKPKFKVGTEWVQKGMNAELCLNNVSAITRATFDRLFSWLIEMCNKTLNDPTMTRVNFIGVLDIAGFEIFDFNTFEQICINFCNEKLQQFFNHHMFVLEQEEYVKEGIEWQMVDFGMDLQATIVLFEKPMGLLAILEEESLFPKATDKSFEEKLKENLLGKSPVFLKKQPGGKDKNAHFAIAHYAGTVNYNLTDWLTKNKDPLNDTVVDVIKRGNNPLMVHLFRAHPGQGPEAFAEDKKKGKKGKQAGFKTVSSAFKFQLDSLLGTLHATDPHFIRCLVPNTHKMPGHVEPHLVLHQLTCNGVLEGIRICRRGFPNRQGYKEFKGRYIIINPKVIYAAKEDLKKGTGDLLAAIPELNDRYRLGHTKVFFRAGALGVLEEMRDSKIAFIINCVQSLSRRFLLQMDYKKLKAGRQLLPLLQRNVRKYMFYREWEWFNLIVETRKFIGQKSDSDEIEAMEAEAAIHCSKYDEHKAVYDKCKKENDAMEKEKEEILEKIASEQGDLGQYTTKVSKLQSEIAQLEADLKAEQDSLNKEEKRKNEMAATKRQLEGDLGTFKKDIDDIELAIQKADVDKANKDYQIRSLNDNIATQDELISKLNKEKKYMQENNAKGSDDLLNAEDKLEHLTKVKAKLEQTFDELEDSLEREKKHKNEVDKQRRKVESDFRISQECITDLEREKREIENSIARKEKDISTLSSKLNDEQSIVEKIQKQIKELQGRIEEQEEELEAERQARMKAEQQRSQLARELEDLGDRLDEAGGATAAQRELNKKRESEVTKLRKDLEEANIQQEAIITSLKKKHQDAVAEMTEQLDQLNKMKAKIEKEKHAMRCQIDDMKSACDSVSHEKASIEKNNKLLQNNLTDVSRQVEEANLQLSEFDQKNRKITCENTDLFRQLEEIDVVNMQLAKIKQTLQSNLDEQGNIADQEAKERDALVGKYRNLEHAFDNMKDQLEEERSSKADAQRQLNKATTDANIWRQKYQNEGLVKAEELEASKMKLQARLAEAESVVDTSNQKCIGLEKSKAFIQGQMEEMQAALDAATTRQHAAEKKAKQFDKVVAEWKAKVDSYTRDLDSAQKDARNMSTELFKVKGMYEEGIAQLDEVRRENKMLSNEIKDIMDQISEGGRNIHEIDKMRKKLEAEKVELQAALEEAESILEHEENKVLRCQLELNQVKLEIERRLKEKDEEFEMIRKTHAKAIESMQMALEVEAKSKAEALRMKKKLEADICELDIALESATLIGLENQRTIKKFQNMIKQVQELLDAEMQVRDATREAQAQADRKVHALQTELEEIRTHLETSDRARRVAEQDLADAHDHLSELMLQNNSIVTAKRKLESEMQALHTELDEMLGESRIIEDRAHKAMVDAARLADELRTEQEAAVAAERQRHIMELQVKDTQTKLDELEQAAIKGGKKALARAEHRVRELEGQLDEESRRHGDANKNLRKAERKMKELQFVQEEDVKNRERMQQLVDQLQGKVKTYKKQIEEAEEIAALNLAKFKQVQSHLEESGERADLNEQAFAKYKARGRAASIGPA